jgi:hypothetical protein
VNPDLEVLADRQFADQASLPLLRTHSLKKKLNLN